MINQLVKYYYCAHYHMRKVAVMATGLAIALLSNVLSVPLGFCGDQYSQNAQNKQRTNLRRTSSAADILILQLKDGTDQEEFDSFLKQVHCTVIKTLEFGTKVRLVVIQTEPGAANKIEKQLCTNKQVARIQRNVAYRAESVSNKNDSEKKPKDDKTTQDHKKKVDNKKADSEKKVDSEKKKKAIRSAVAKQRRRLNPIPNDPQYSVQWDMSFMQFTQARRSNASLFNTPATIIFLDSGVSIQPGELGTAAVQYDCSDPINPTGAQESPFDTGYHGTATASVTCTTDNDLVLAGMANWEGNRCFLMEYRIVPVGSIDYAYIFNILFALNDIYNNPNIKPCPIVLSYTSAPPNTFNANPMLQQVAQQLMQKGFLITLCAGNFSAYDPSPELYIRRVAAINQNGTLASFSDYGPFRAAAPGANIPIMDPNHSPYTPYNSGIANGTSYASPRWAAAIVDVMAALPSSKRTAVYADQILFQTATITADGWSVPNLQAAMQAAANTH